ncbi:MAG: DUF5050 domain-containing protein [Clostridiales bacterium]|nr:DUF5050 domain-containing protein [Clostridiales bacterium]
MELIQNVFSWVVQTSIIASVLIISILIIKHILKDRLGVRWHYAIWFIVIFRLIVPYAPESNLSILNLFTMMNQEVVQLETPPSISEPRPNYPNEVADKTHKDTSNDISDIVINKNEKPTSGEQNQSGLDPQPVQNQQNQTPVEQIQPEQIQPEQNKQGLDNPIIIQPVQPPFEEESHSAIEWIQRIEIQQLIFYICLAGAILIGSFMFTVNLKFRININCEKRGSLEIQEGISLVLDECKAVLGIKGKINIKYTEKVKTPALFGVISPNILMPTSMRNAMTESDMKYIILHELAHLKRKDNTANLITNILQVLHWFNPMIWFGFSKMRDDRELACDAAVLFHLNDHEINHYGKAIVNILRSYTTPIKLPGLTGIIEKKSQAKRRIERIARFSKKSYKWSIVAVLVLVIMSISMLTNPRALVLENDETSNPEDSVSDFFTASTEVIPEDDLANLYIKAAHLEDKGDWTYFYGLPLDREEGSAYSLSSGPIYRIKSDGTSKTKIVDGVVEFIGLKDDWLYYKESNSLYRINLINGDKSLILRDVTGKVVIEGDWIYLYAGELIRINTDGTERETITNEKFNDFILHKDRIYYSTYKGLSEISINGTNKIVIVDRPIDYMAIWDNKIYYNYTSTSSETSVVLIDGLEKEFINKLYTNYVNYLDLAGDDYGTAYSDSYTYGGSGRFEGIINGWLLLQGEGGYYVRKIDGEESYNVGFYDDVPEISVDDEAIYVVSRNSLNIRTFDNDLRVNTISQNEEGVFNSDQIINKAFSDAVKDNIYYNITSVYEDEDWIYYMSLDSIINRVSTDYKVNIPIVSNVQSFVGIHDGWIYYINGYNLDYEYTYDLFRVKVDGTDVEKVNDNYYSNGAKIVGDWFYGADFDKIHKMKLDGTEEVVLYDGQSQYTIFTDEWIYFQPNNNYLYRVNFDGSKLEQVSTYRLQGLGYMKENDGWIYYRITSSYEGNEDGLYRIKGDGLRTDKLIGKDFSGGFAIYEDWIYYTKDSWIHKMRLNGEDDTKIYENDTENISVTEVTDTNIVFYSYYTHEDPLRYPRCYKIDIDGTNKKEILDYYDVYGRETP